MRRTRVKICGITSVEDAQAAVAAGADAIGLVFHRGSPRYVSVENAARIVASLPPFVTPVALFVDPDRELVESTIERTGVAMLQFHGEELPAECSGFGRPWIKAGRVRAGFDMLAFAEQYRDASGLLLDAWSADAPGGTGQTFDWSRVPPQLARRMILAGGLHDGNVGEAIRALRPYAVDVSSGVEASPGRKDGARIEAFMRVVRSSEQG